MSAVIVKKPSTFLESLLSATGIGISQSMQQFYRERDRKRGVTQSLIEGVLSGEISPELLATDLGQSFQRQLGVEKESSLKQATEMGLEKYSYPERKKELPDGAVVTMPGVTPTEIPYESYRRSREEAKEIEAQTEQQRKLRFYTAQKRIDKIVEREFRMPLGKRWESAWSEYERAIKTGIPVSKLVVRDPETGSTMTMDTHMAQLGRQRADETIKTKAGIAYLKEEVTYNNFLMDAEKFVNKLANAETMEPDEFESDFMRSEIRLWQGKELTPEQIRTQARRRLPIINAKILAQHKILRKQRFLVKDLDIKLPFLKEFKLDEILNPDRYAGEFESIKAYTDLIKKSDQEALRAVAIKEAKMRESLSLNDTREVVIPPERPKQPTDSEVEKMAQELVASNKRNAVTGKRMTIEEAKELVKKYLAGR